MKNAEFAKSVAGYITFPAIYHIVSKALTPETSNKNSAERLILFYAKFTIASIMAGATVEHVKRKIDNFSVWYDGPTVSKSSNL